MAEAPRVFLDTSVLFAAVRSESGASRLIFRLGQARAIGLWVGPWVLSEAEAVLAAKAVQSGPLFALLMEQAMVRVVKEAGPNLVRDCLTLVGHAADAQVLAEACAAEAQYLVSLDRRHLVGNPRLSKLPFPVGTPGDFLAWLRARLAGTPPAPRS